MSSPAKPRQPSPELFFDTMNAYQRTAALKAAIHLDVFTAIAEGNATPSAIAPRCQASERGIRILCDYLVIIGFLTKQGSAYQLSADSAMFLDRRSPAYLGSAEGFLASPLLIDAYKDMAAAVRKGGTVIDQHALGPEHPAWVEFARSMGPMMAFSRGADRKVNRRRFRREMESAGHRCRPRDIRDHHCQTQSQRDHFCLGLVQCSRSGE
jgi:hypothetical protein